MDGVLVDSEDFIRDAAIEMFAEQNLTVRPDDFRPFVGSGEDKYLGGVAEKYGHPFDLSRDKKRAYEIYDEKVKGKLTPLPGVKAFLHFCSNNNLKTAVATSADAVKMHINLREMGIPTSTFDATINGSEVTNKKPDPEIFLKAASKLGLEPRECLVVEDAVNGVEAAIAAGCYCLALTTSFDETQLKKAQWITTDLSAVPKALINKLTKKI